MREVQLIATIQLLNYLKEWVNILISIYFLNKEMGKSYFNQKKFKN